MVPDGSCRGSAEHLTPDDFPGFRRHLQGVKGNPVVAIELVQGLLATSRYPTHPSVAESARAALPTRTEAGRAAVALV